MAITVKKAAVVLLRAPRASPAPHKLGKPEITERKALDISAQVDLACKQYLSYVEDERSVMTMAEKGSRCANFSRLHLAIYHTCQGLVFVLFSLQLEN